MEEKHDIVAPVFKAKGKPVSKAKISSQPVVKMRTVTKFCDALFPRNKLWKS